MPAVCLWFDGQAEEAARFYVEAFRSCGRDAAAGAVARWGEGGPAPAGSVLTAAFTLEGQEFLALNGGPHFTFTPALSLVVRCADQAGIDRFWDALGNGGAPGRCGWLTDRFGVSWQVVPEALPGMLCSGSAEQAGRVMQAVLGMGRLDVAALQRAYDGE